MLAWIPDGCAYTEVYKGQCLYILRTRILFPEIQATPHEHCGKHCYAPCLFCRGSSDAWSSCERVAISAAMVTGVEVQIQWTGGWWTESSIVWRMVAVWGVPLGALGPVECVQGSGP